jgi:RNA polymerase sigma-70 factor, ECF subfamily
MIQALPPQQYEQLRAMAAKFLASERAGHTLQPTALAHEAYIRLATTATVDDRVRFLALAAVTIRHILVDHARKRSALKRGGGAVAAMDASLLAASSSGVDVLDFDQALERLARMGEREAAIVVLRIYGGLTLEEAADAMGISTRTAASDWALARAFLRRELSAYREGTIR